MGGGSMMGGYGGSMMSGGWMMLRPSNSCGRGSGDGTRPDATSLATLTLTPGRYELVCSLPGHYATGMFTELDVSLSTNRSQSSDIRRGHPLYRDRLQPDHRLHLSIRSWRKAESPLRFACSSP